MADGGKVAVLLQPADGTVKNVVSKRLKFLLLAFSFFFWICGTLFCAIGGYVISQSIGYQVIRNSYSPATCLAYSHHINARFIGSVA